MDSKTGDINKLSSEIRQKFSEPSMGSYIPRLVIASANAEKVISGYSYKQLKEAKKCSRDLSKKLKEINPLTGLSGDEETDDSEEVVESEDDTTTVYTPETWVSAQGKRIRATFVSLNGDQLTLKLKGGKTYTMPLSKLNASSQTRAKDLAGE